MIAVTMLLSGCSFGTIEEQKTGDVIYEIVKKEEIPEQLKEEIKEAGKKEMWISYADTGKEETYLYVVRGYGTQQTTGYIHLQFVESIRQPGLHTFFPCPTMR